MRTKKLTSLALVSALALMLSYVEFLLPPIYAAVPGIKVGLPNIVILFVLYKYGVKEAAAVSGVRMLLSTLFFGNPVMLIYSLAGAALSLAFMCLFKRINLFSEVGVSIIGGVMHNLGQILVAMVLLETAEIAYYMLVLAISGTLAGVFIGIAGALLMKQFNKC
ncbi:MAG: Gx transporter family protein [Clostridia bacterium]|nr:Gx transporter family protein [Clostridia bacterium]